MPSGSRPRGHRRNDGSDNNECPCRFPLASAGSRRRNREASRRRRRTDGGVCGGRTIVGAAFRNGGTTHSACLATRRNKVAGQARVLVPASLPATSGKCHAL